ncbi:MAG: hypothetical protein IPL53_09570 [Ignavibacteria bacterium]|nr:hypothetical protein [Ignavibacteria bacterium]
MVKELKEPYIELRNEEGTYTPSVYLNKTYKLKGYNFSPSRSTNDFVRVYINDSLMYNVSVFKNGTFEQEIFPSRIIDSDRFQIDVEGIYNSEIVRRTLLIQVLRNGDEFEPLDARR